MVDRDEDRTDHDRIEQASAHDRRARGQSPPALRSRGPLRPIGVSAIQLSTFHAVSSTVPSTHLTTATGCSVSRGFCGAPPQIRSTSARISCSVMSFGHPGQSSRGCRERALGRESTRLNLVHDAAGDPLW